LRLNSILLIINKSPIPWTPFLFSQLKSSPRFWGTLSFWNYGDIIILARHLLSMISGVLGEPIDVRGKLTDIDTWHDHVL